MHNFEHAGLPMGTVKIDYKFTKPHVMCKVLMVYNFQCASDVLGSLVTIATNVPRALRHHLDAIVSTAVPV